MDRLFLDANIFVLRRLSAGCRHRAFVAFRRCEVDDIALRRRVTGISGLPPGIKLPEKDRPILQAAIQARATHLLTGDKRHFGRYFGNRYGGVLVLAPAEYFQSKAH